MSRRLAFGETSEISTVSWSRLSYPLTVFRYGINMSRAIPFCFKINQHTRQVQACYHADVVAKVKY